MKPESYKISKNYQVWDFFALENIQLSGKDGWDVYPSAIKSIAIAGDGVGNYLSLFLEDDSAHHLGNEIFELVYGGTIEKKGKLNFVFKKN